MVRYKSLKRMGYPKYRVGDNGTVWRWRGEKRGWHSLKQSPAGNGYLKVRLFSRGLGKTYAVHRVVLTAFVGLRPHGMVARHFPNQDRKDNRLCNLSWSTPERNMQDRLINGTDVRGSKHIRAKLTEKQVWEILKLHKKGEVTLRYIAAKFGVSIPLIGNIVVKRAWRHLHESSSE